MGWEFDGFQNRAEVNVRNYSINTFTVYYL